MNIFYTQLYYSLTVRIILRGISCILINEISISMIPKQKLREVDKALEVSYSNLQCT